VKVRTPHFDFSTFDANWAPEQPESAHMLDAIGIIPAYIEPFLIKVLNRAKTLLDPVDDAELIARIDWFNKQEGQHYKMHRAPLKILRENGYEGMAEYEHVYERDYDRFFAEKSLRWLLAYCDGFEAQGGLAAPFVVDGPPSQTVYGESSNPMLPDIWRWHLAEEYEHRTVVFDVYHRLYGRKRISSYFARVYGLVYQTVHLQRRSRPLGAYLIRKDRETMTPAELERSHAREKAATEQAKSQVSRQILALLPALSPFYNPARNPAPKNQDAVLALYE
jgi:predicted metal-dependent hydrolase